jgi:nitrate reductase gamma subunit
VLLVLIGHIGGLLVPKSWTEAVGITEHAYHLSAVFIGTVAGLCTLIGLGILIARRRLTGPVFAATTKNDKTMYVVLVGVIVLGLLATVKANIAGDGYDYRETISPWFRSLFYLQPDPDLMAAVPLSFKVHILMAFALFAFWPFTRLVHAFSAPVGYVTRPYVVYRSRDGRPGLRPGRPGWEGPPRAPSSRTKTPR